MLALHIFYSAFKLRKDKRGRVQEGDYMNYTVNQRLNEMV